MLAVVRRNPQFRTLWSAQLVSQAGDWLNRVAVLALIGRLSGDAAALGMGALFGVELALRLLPTAAFGPLAGPVADRLPRRMLMIAADLLRSGVVLGYLLVDQPGELPLLYALLVAQMSVGIFFNAARSAALPNTVRPEDLHAAYALSAATWSTMLTVGALTGGLLVGAVGVRGVFIVDAATYVLSALFLLRLKLPPTPRQPERFRVRDILLFTDLRRAWQHGRERHIIPFLLTKTFWGPAGGFLVLLSVAAHERFSEATDGASTAGLLASSAAGFATGVLYSARGLGTGLGPILAVRRLGSSDRALRGQVTLGFLVAATGYSFFAWTTDLVLAFAFVAAAHMGGSTLWVASTTFWQRKVDDRFRGRTFTLEFLGMTLAFTVGGLIAGMVYDWSGSIRTTTWVVCALVAVNGLAWTALATRAAALVPRAEGPPGSEPESGPEPATNPATSSPES